jgi:cold shock protein
MADDRTITGTIVRLVADKGGFIDREGVSFFFRRSSVEGATFEQLREGQAVRFTEANNATRGPRAARVIA